MKSLRIKQNGFSAVEAILIIFIVGIIGFVGWYAWHTKQMADESLANKNAASLIPNRQGEGYDPEPKKLLSAFYNDYIKYRSSTTTTTSQYDKMMIKYGTTNLISTYNTYAHPQAGYAYDKDIILCNQGGAKGAEVYSFELFGDKSGNGINADMLIKSDPPLLTKVTLRYVNGTGYRVDSVVCDPPAALGPAALN
jgi:Tfp pilus assembly protein PilE